MKEKELERLTNLKSIEEEIYKTGIDTICGIDEAGRGPLAGPVVVAAVIMPRSSMIEGVNDSKKVSEKKREILYDKILDEAISYGVGIIDQKEIDSINILNATKKGLTTAVKQLKVKPQRILVDALENIDTCGIPYTSIIKGDAKSYSIAAASIIAKVTRDRIMREWAEVYPQYNFEKHKELVPMQPGDVPITFADTTALENDLGYKPSTDLRTGLRKFAEWYKEYYG